VVTLFNKTLGYEVARPYRFGVDDATLRGSIEALAAEAHDAGFEIAEQGAAAAAPAGLTLEPMAVPAGPDARAAIALAGQLTNGRRAVIVTVWSSPIRETLSGRALAGVPLTDFRTFMADYDRMFAEGVALARDAGLENVSGETLESGAATWRAIAGAAERHAAALIVAGSRGRSGVAAALLGSVSSGFGHNAETPTLVIRS